MPATTVDPKRPSDVVRTHLSAYLGPFTSKNAVQMVAKQALKADADQVTREQIPALLDGLGPTLRTLLGKAGAEKVVDEIRRELGV